MMSGAWLPGGISSPLITALAPGCNPWAAKSVFVGTTAASKAAEDGAVNPPPDIVGLMPLQIGGATRPLPVGGATKPLPVGGATKPLPVGGTTKPLPVGGNDKPLPIGAGIKPLPVCGAAKPLPVAGTPSAGATAVSVTTPLPVGGMKPLPEAIAVWGAKDSAVGGAMNVAGTLPTDAVCMPFTNMPEYSTHVAVGIVNDCVVGGRDPTVPGEQPPASMLPICGEESATFASVGSANGLPIAAAGEASVVAVGMNAELNAPDTGESAGMLAVGLSTLTAATGDAATCSAPGTLG